MTLLQYPSKQVSGPPSWKDAGVGDVVQAHLLAGARRGQVVNLIPVTGSVGGEHVVSEYHSLQHVIQTVRVVR